MATSFITHVQTGTHAARPGAGTVPQGTLYACSTHGLVYQSDGSSTWADWYGTGAVSSFGSNVNAVSTANAPGSSTSNTRSDHVHLGVTSVSHASNTFSGPVTLTASGVLGITSPAAGTFNLSATGGTSGSGTTADHNHTAAAGDGGDLDAAVIDGHLVFNEEAAPSTPSSGTVAVYAKSDGRIYSMDDAGTEYGPFDAAGGGGPLLYVDSLAVGATGDEFADMSAWTATGSVTNTLVTTNVYDATIQRLVFTTIASTDRYTKSAPDADFTAYLTMYGTDQEDLIGWGYVNTSGTGCGIAWRAGTVWSVVFSGWVFSSSPTQVWQDPPDWPIAASPYMGSATQFRIARSGSDIIVAVSYDGGSVWLAVHTFSGGSPAGSKLWLLGDFLNPSTYRLNVGRLTVT